MVHSSVLVTFKIEHEAYLSIKVEDEAKVPKINDRDNDLKIILWAQLFKDYLSSYYGSRGPLIYVLHEVTTVSDEVIDPLLSSCYCGERSSLIAELKSRLPHSGPIFKNDNATVYVTIEELLVGHPWSLQSNLSPFVSMDVELSKL